MSKVFLLAVNLPWKGNKFSIQSSAQRLLSWIRWDSLNESHLSLRCKCEIEWSQKHVANPNVGLTKSYKPSRSIGELFLLVNSMKAPVCWTNAGPIGCAIFLKTHQKKPYFEWPSGIELPQINNRSFPPGQPVRVGRARPGSTRAGPACLSSKKPAADQQVTQVYGGISWWVKLSAPHLLPVHLLSLSHPQVLWGRDVVIRTGENRAAASRAHSTASGNCLPEAAH